MVRCINEADFIFRGRHFAKVPPDNNLLACYCLLGCEISVDLALSLRDSFKGFGIMAVI